MTIDEFPQAPTGRPIWLITLADLALLLVGFFVLLQANQQVDRHALANGLRAGFGMPAADAPTPEPMPVAAAGLFHFAPGSAALPGASNSLAIWAREALADPRVTLDVTGSVDGSAADVDPATGSGAVLAADRARAVAAALAAAHVVAPGRITITTRDHDAQRRAVVVTLGFAGQQP